MTMCVLFLTVLCRLREV